MLCSFPPQGLFCVPRDSKQHLRIRQALSKPAIQQPKAVNQFSQHPRYRSRRYFVEESENANFIPASSRRCLVLRSALPARSRSRDMFRYCCPSSVPCFRFRCTRASSLLRRLLMERIGRGPNPARRKPSPTWMSVVVVMVSLVPRSFFVTCLFNTGVE